jgi:hypothetical protein
MILDLSPERFPFFTRSRKIGIQGFTAILKLQDDWTLTGESSWSLTPKKGDPPDPGPATLAGAGSDKSVGLQFTSTGLIGDAYLTAAQANDPGLAGDWTLQAPATTNGMFTKTSQVSTASQPAAAIGLSDALKDLFLVVHYSISDSNSKP